MIRHRSWAVSVMIGMLLAGALGSGCSPKATTGAFTQVNRLDSELQRGVSTKMDVRRVLGAPKGFGSSLLPTEQRPREIWYYEDIEVTDVKSEAAGVLRANLRQQILVVFFDREVFDGFMWFSNAAVATGQ